MKSIVLFVMFLMAGGISVTACDFTFSLINSQGESLPVTTDQSIPLIAGETYTLHMSYWEDHRSCPLGPEGTIFLLDGARWRAANDSQALILTSLVWDDGSSRTKTGNAVFTVGSMQTCTLEILRICHREGYSGKLTFYIL